MPAAILILAQLPQSNPPPPLPAGPLWERTLLEQPLGLIAGLVVAAIVAFVVLNRRGQLKQAGLAAAGLLALAAGLWLLAAAIDTPREQLVQETTTLIDATAAADSRALDTMLAGDAHLTSRFRIPESGGPQSGLNRTEVLTAVERTLGEKFRLKDHSIKQIQATLDSPTTGRTQAKVWVQLEIGVPNTSWWLIHWRRTTPLHDGEGEWRVTAIEPMDIPGLSSDR